ncbi:hypothetical protein HY989_06090 [Candidatus Micrarchaeota archaeon]|nr:hypothetical protein [Candidatus Micrarchaeota archaeon]
MKGFFSFVSIALVALLLIVAASYIFTYRDVREAAQKDLEVRRFSERFADARLALNYTLIDAIMDSAYIPYKCTNDFPSGLPAFYSELTNRVPQYLDNFSDAFSDGIVVNATQTNTFACADEIGGPTELTSLFNGTILKVEKSQQCAGFVDLTVSSENMFVTENNKYNFNVDISNTSILMFKLFAVQIRGIGINGTTFATVILCEP